ncbi:DNA primase DnaG [Halococcus saccharolyticus]|uniref:DNA primase DnaG n=1 Tax=Halococcus saccharolyticus DSM 5350 TaxID=1227455 RepID=M0MEB2_9EURY|nr:DNA primase DnaG [Halococcus saccharolyticus]EMA44102.1 DNA primase [Halococcus saccharolyticus DSM 5350]
MEDSAKYLIHADVTAEGVVERNDVVGAVFGQTEGLLGDDLDLRTLQDASKVGRIDVTINSRNGQSFGRITIASGLDKVETAILGASLETIDRIGPCRSTVDVDRIEDVRAAKRREVVDRAKALLGAFEETTMSSAELVEAVRESARTGEITTYEGLPAGPRVADADAIIVVEGRADVLTLLGYGVKNAIAVEGTNVPDAVAALTTERTTTAFLDGDRGGDLILKELDQVGDVDYVAVAPTGESVEDLSREAALSALREKVAYDLVAGASSPREAVAATDGSLRPAPESAGPAPPVEPDGMAGPNALAGQVETAVDDAAGDSATESAASTELPSTEPDSTDKGDETGEQATTERAGSAGGDAGGETTGETDEPGSDEPADSDPTDDESPDTEPDAAPEPETLQGHVRAVIDDGSELVRLLDTEFETVAEAPAAAAFDTIAEATAVPASVVLDGELSQRVLDIAAQRGVEQIVARSEGEFVKKPTGVRVRTAAQLRPESDGEADSSSAPGKSTSD